MNVSSNNLTIQQFSNFEKFLGLLMLVGAIVFNLEIYRLEPSATVDPNDNTFQYALVDRTNQIWDFANKSCPKDLSFVICHLSFLSDHWVPNWAEGYNLPYYYSHVPQIIIVTSWRVLSHLPSPIYQLPTLFQYYHWVIYLLLSFFPLSVFLALTVAGLSPIAAGFGAIIGTQLSTDGLYGLDPASFLWRGYGLSSQLFAMIWLPPALAYAYKWFSDKHTGYLIPAILFLAATTAGHLGIGIIAFLSVGVLAIAPSIRMLVTNQWDKQSVPALLRVIRRGSFLLGGVSLLLGYWIIPIVLHGNYHNTSVWDPIWKFDSYGFRMVLKNFFNGDLFDFGRLPVLTGLVFIGLFAALRKTYFPFAILFLFFLLIYFGTTTWGSILYLIPGMADFHISRFIVGVHIAGLFLIPLALEWFTLTISKNLNVRLFVTLLLCLFVTLLISPQTYRYATYNDTLITRANTNYDAQIFDANLLLSTLRPLQMTRPGRVFTGRGGVWGKQLKIAETPYYMYLSTYGIPTVLWLPETWSPNSDTEQYFRENVEADYNLYNIRYVVTPARNASQSDAGGPVDIQPFWKPLTASKTWILYSVIPAQAGIPKTIPDQVGNDNNADGYITTGVRPAIVSTAKENYLNVVRLWIQSDFPKQGLYPELTFDKDYPKNSGLPNFRMIDEVTYRVPDGSIHNLFAENPSYVAPKSEKFVTPAIGSQTNDHDMVFTASVEVPIGCNACIVILKQSFHPSWHATLDGKTVPTFAVFPFFTAVQVDTPGTHQITFAYRPSAFKVTLLFISFISLGALFYLACSNALQKIKARP